jgi:phenylacetate-coenzyme A ligase PaaK-like adenylate-forming protein
MPPTHVSERIPRSGNVGLFAVRHLLAAEPLAAIRDAVGAFRPEVVLAYPSIAALLAEEQTAGRLDIRPRVISTHSEALTEGMRARIRAAWGVEAFNHYGLTEEPHVAADCDQHGGLHLFEDTSVIEIVDDENRPVPDGTPGSKWLLTNLSNLAQPLIRYEVDDVLTRAPGLCVCGRPFGRLAALSGRQEDVLHLPARAGGAPVPVAPLVITMGVERFPEIVEYAVSQSPDRIVAMVVPRAGVDGDTLRAAVADALACSIRSAGAMAPPIDVSIVNRIARSPERMGKLRVVGGAPPISVP